MAVDLQYVDSTGNIFNLYQNPEGFWVSLEDVQPVQFQEDFSPVSILDDSLIFEQTQTGGWFQIDEVYLATSLVGDTFTIDAKYYEDELPENPQLYGEVAVFPNPLSDVFVPINEYITESSMNSIIEKLQENFDFLVDKAKYLTVPPTHISFRYGPSNYPEYEDLGNVWQQLDNGLSTYWDYDNSLSAENVAGTSNAMLYSTGGFYGISGAYEITGVSSWEVGPPSALSSMSASYIVESSSGVEVLTGSELIGIPTISAVDPTEYNRDYYIYGDDTFDNIISLEVDSNEYIWALDQRAIGLGKIGIFNFENDIWKYVSSWGTTLSGNPKYFVNPTDMKIKDDRVYIACDKADTGVECRIFDVGGSYIGSANSEELSAIESLAITDDYIIALLNNELHKFDTTTFQFVETISLEDKVFKYDYISQGYQEGELTKLANNTTGEFFYGISTNLIYKFGQAGAISEAFGETVVNHMNSGLSATAGASYIKPVTDVYHDFNFNLYSSSSHDVVTYYERAESFNRLIDDESFNIDDYTRGVDLNNVDSNENTTAWIYNRIFDRILDNLNIYRLALKGSLALISTKTFEKVVINNFTPEQMVELPYTKADISIGINELHCEGALNRCIGQLNECFETCLGYLNIRATGEDPDSISIESFTLDTQVDPSPLAELIDGVYYFDYLRPVEQFQFAWEDQIVYRSDPKLRAYMTFDSDPEINLSWLPTPNRYEDPQSINGGEHTWILRETYGAIEKTAEVEVAWNRKIYYGTYPDGANITDADILLAQGFVIQPEFEDTIEIDVANDERYFVAIPLSEYNWITTPNPDDRKVKLYHPDYPEMLYNFLSTQGTIYTKAGFNNGYANAGSYIILTPNRFGDIYTDGVIQIKFRLTREI